MARNVTRLGVPVRGGANLNKTNVTQPLNTPAYVSGSVVGTVNFNSNPAVNNKIQATNTGQGFALAAGAEAVGFTLEGSTIYYQSPTQKTAYNAAQGEMQSAIAQESYYSNLIKQAQEPNAGLGPNASPEAIQNWVTNFHEQMFPQSGPLAGWNALEYYQNQEQQARAAISANAPTAVGSLNTTTGALTANNAKIAHPIYGTYGSNSNQYLGTIYYAPTVANGQLGLAYSGFASTGITATHGQTVFNANTGQNQNIGVTLTGQTAYNETTGQITVNFPNMPALPVGYSYVNGAEAAVTGQNGGPLSTTGTLQVTSGQGSTNYSVSYDAKTGLYSTNAPKVLTGSQTVNGVSVSSSEALVFSPTTGSASYGSPFYTATLPNGQKVTGSTISTQYTYDNTVFNFSIDSSGNISSTPVSQQVSLGNGIDTTLFYSQASKSWGFQGGGSTYQTEKNGIKYTATLGQQAGGNLGITVAGAWDTSSPYYGVYLANQAAKYGQQLYEAETAFGAGKASSAQVTLLEQAGLVLAPYTETVNSGTGTLFGNPTSKPIFVSDIKSTSPSSTQGYATSIYGNNMNAQTYQTTQALTKEQYTALQQAYGTNTANLLAGTQNVGSSITGAVYNAPIVGGFIVNEVQKFDIASGTLYSSKATTTQKAAAVGYILTADIASPILTGLGIGQGISFVGGFFGLGAASNAAAVNAALKGVDYIAGAEPAGSFITDEGASTLAKIGNVAYQTAAASTKWAVAFGSIQTGQIITGEAMQGQKVTYGKALLAGAEQAGMVYAFSFGAAGLGYGVSAARSAILAIPTQADVETLQAKATVLEVKATATGKEDVAAFYGQQQTGYDVLKGFNAESKPWTGANAGNFHGQDYNLLVKGGVFYQVNPASEDFVAAYKGAGNQAYTLLTGAAPIDENSNLVAKYFGSPDINYAKVSVFDVGTKGKTVFEFGQGAKVNGYVTTEYNLDTYMGATEQGEGVGGGSQKVDVTSAKAYTTNRFRQLLGLGYHVTDLGTPSLETNGGMQLVTAKISDIIMPSAEGANPTIKDTAKAVVITSRTFETNDNMAIDRSGTSTKGFVVTQVGTTDLGNEYSGIKYSSGNNNVESLIITEVGQFKDFNAAPETNNPEAKPVRTEDYFQKAFSSSRYTKDFVNTAKAITGGTTDVSNGGDIVAGSDVLRGTDVNGNGLNDVQPSDIVTGSNGEAQIKTVKAATSGIARGTTLVPTAPTEEIASLLADEYQPYAMHVQPTNAARYSLLGSYTLTKTTQPTGSNVNQYDPLKLNSTSIPSLATNTAVKGSTVTKAGSQVNVMGILKTSTSNGITQKQFNNQNQYYGSGQVTKSALAQAQKQSQTQKQAQQEQFEMNLGGFVAPYVDFNLDFGTGIPTLPFNRKKPKKTDNGKAPFKPYNFGYVTDITASSLGITAPKGSKKFYMNFGIARPIL